VPDSKRSTRRSKKTNGKRIGESPPEDSEEGHVLTNNKSSDCSKGGTTLNPDPATKKLYVIVPMDFHPFMADADTLLERFHEDPMFEEWGRTEILQRH
jgi:hypothetical protein